MGTVGFEPTTIADVCDDTTSLFQRTLQALPLSYVPLTNWDSEFPVNPCKECYYTYYHYNEQESSHNFLSQWDKNQYKSHNFSTALS